MTLAERPLARKTMIYSSSGAGITTPESFVKLTTTAGECIESNSANDIPEGVTQEDIAAGAKNVQLITAGEAKVIGSEAMSLGEFIVPSTAGKFKGLIDSDSDYGLQYVFGRLKEAISQNGYNGLAEINKFLVGKTIREVIPSGTISASGNIAKFVPRFIARLTKAYIIVDTTITAHDTNYWTFALVNKGQNGSGSTAMLAATDPNTTKATGGSGITNYQVRELTLHGTTANLVVARNDVLVFTGTKAASGADLVLPHLVLDFELTIPGAVS